MNRVSKSKENQVAKIARRVQERLEAAPNVSADMVDGVAQLCIGESNEPSERLKLMDALGTDDMDILSPLLAQLGNAVSTKGKIDEASLQFVVGFIKSVKPKDEIEMLLAGQMAAVHICAMDSSRRYLWGESLAQKDSAERALNKLTRTFATQVDALKRYRSKAQQTVRVERVNVENGGQAIVGDVHHGGGSNDER